MTTETTVISPATVKPTCHGDGPTVAEPPRAARSAGKADHGRHAEAEDTPRRDHHAAQLLLKRQRPHPGDPPATGGAGGHQDGHADGDDLPGAAPVGTAASTGIAGTSTEMHAAVSD